MHSPLMRARQKSKAQSIQIYVVKEEANGRESQENGICEFWRIDQLYGKKCRLICFFLFSPFVVFSLYVISGYWILDAIRGNFSPYVSVCVCNINVECMIIQLHSHNREIEEPEKEKVE